jgi:ParB family chromosome partitioning protein
MKIAIDRIIVNEETRIRQDPGNIAPLENSIRKVGLLNPVLVDENDTLVAGFRRLAACRNLGWEEIEVNMVSFDGDLLKMLNAEVDENLFRKDFTWEEIESIEKRRQEILRELQGNIFQRFWSWLKGLFRRKKKAPGDEPSTEKKEAGESVLEAPEKEQGDKRKEVKPPPPDTPPKNTEVPISPTPPPADNHKKNSGIPAIPASEDGNQ